MRWKKHHDCVVLRGAEARDEGAVPPFTLVVYCTCGYSCPVIHYDDAEVYRRLHLEEVK